VSAISKQHENVFLTFLKEHNLINNKHVPDSFKINSRHVRLQVLAGLIDTDGYLINNVYEITQKSKQLADDLVFLARSVGLATRTVLVEKACMYKGERRAGLYYRTYISGDIDMIPVKILRKTAQPRTQIKDVLRYGITVTPLGEDDYYGFMIDGNHRYVLGDFTVTHNTCTAIQVAEEYILRPEFQDKKVLVVASAAVQDNFQTQIFDMSRVSLDPISGILESKQCTGRRYLDMLLRIENEPKNWSNPDVRDRLEKTSKKLIDEFYEFAAYASFGNVLNDKLTGTEAEVAKNLAWVHETFDNRLVIIDEAHNLRESGDEGVSKGVTVAMEKLVKIANNMTLVFLSATPMFDTFDEIVFFMNLCLWNDRTQAPTQSVVITDFFNPDATLKSGGAGERFRDWCQQYVSFVKGDSPFTFPFRLPAPKSVSTSRPKSFLGKSIGDGEDLQYISLVVSEAQGLQKDILNKVERTDATEPTKKFAYMQPTIITLPKPSFEEVFRVEGKQYAYVNEKCLSTELLPNYSAKYASIINTLLHSKGIALVYSNYKKYGARPFAMALEEHGFSSANGPNLLANPAYSGTSKGKYILLTSDVSESEIQKLIERVKSPKNRNGEQIRVIVTSPIVSEGVDFRYVRQIHILDPWWNSSRIEQVVGRGLRTCSHQLLPFEDQNCTVYFHVVRSGDRECFDEYTYRTKVVPKAIKIARVRKVMAESAMDCPLMNTLNTLPEEWKTLEVTQKRSEGPQVTFKLNEMLGPAFDDAPDVAECIVRPGKPDNEHVRPLSTYLDVRDELLTRLAQLLIDKPIWDREQLIVALRPYTADVVIYNLQQAITSAFRFKDAFGRASLLESKGDLYALAPIGVPNATLIERTTQPPAKGSVSLPREEVSDEPVPAPAPVQLTPDILSTKRDAISWPADITERFSETLLNGYVFDHTFTEPEKRAYLSEIRTNPSSLPFASRLYVPGSELIVRGKNDFEPPTEPVFEEKTRVEAWTSALVANFIARKKDVFITLNSDGKMAIARSLAGTGPPERDLTVKRYTPIACGTGAYAKKDIKDLAVRIDKNGKGVPEEASTEVICMYAELLAREEHNCFWITPEEYSVLYDGKGTKSNRTNQDLFTEAFKITS
jgi:hypothetical protein